MDLFLLDVLNRGFLVSRKGILRVSEIFQSGVVLVVAGRIFGIGVLFLREVFPSKVMNIARIIVLNI